MAIKIKENLDMTCGVYNSQNVNNENKIPDENKFIVCQKSKRKPPVNPNPIYEGTYEECVEYCKINNFSYEVYK